MIIAHTTRVLCSSCFLSYRAVAVVEAAAAV